MNSQLLAANREINPVRALVHSRSFGVMVFMAAHVPLALAIRQVPLLGQIQALGALGVGLVWANRGAQPGRIATVAAYMAGAEVLWRMTGASPLWEFSAYAVVAILSLGLLKARTSGHANAAPVLYLALLLPGAILTLQRFGITTLAQEQLSFYLCGPLALAASALFFQRNALDVSDRKAVLLGLLAPIVGIGTLALSGTVTARAITFTQESNFVTSGGFGPNQVSAALVLQRDFA